VIEILKNYPEGLTVTQLTNISNLNRSGIDHACNALFKQGEITREEIVKSIYAGNKSYSQRKMFLFKLKNDKVYKE